MAHLDLLQLDKDIARAARAERKWLRSMRADATVAANEPWWEPVRHATTRATFQQIAELSDGDPFREPMLAWVQRLSLTRIARVQIFEAASARQKAAYTIDKPERITVSARSLVSRVLGETDYRSRARVGRRPRRDRPRGSSRRENAAPGRDRNHRTSRRGRARSRLALRQSVAARRGQPFRRSQRRRQRPRFSARRKISCRSSIASSRATCPAFGPHASHARWLFDQFQSSELLDGLALDLGPTPATLGASSFARTLARFGAAYARAVVSSSATFVHAHDPTDAHPLRRGALFASLLADPIYLRKQLAFSRDAAEKAARALGGDVSRRSAPGGHAHARRLCARFELRDPRSHRARAFYEGFRLAGGVLPRPSRRAGLRFAAMLLATEDREMLRSEFDDDWFRNPRALFFLRERDEALDGGRATRKSCSKARPSGWRSRSKSR